ncbi:hypothetical protein EIP86_002903 [Pleurotus ostreatoroseus]|nr:hypothetical protein EIP86_002903 [Pleurotus ostreatoroseus]
MDGSQPGQAGVLAWCNSIRTSIAKDPGREFLDAQIQKQGFDFLESYREGIFSKQREAPMIELLKTPSRKKDAGKKTRSAAAMAAKVKAANAALQDDDSIFKENTVPANEFHKALLQAKGNDSKSNFASDHSSYVDTSTDDAKHLKTLTIVEAEHTDRMDVDETEKLLPPASGPIPSAAVSPPDREMNIPTPQAIDRTPSIDLTTRHPDSIAGPPVMEPASQTPAPDISEPPIQPEQQQHIEVEVAEENVQEPAQVHDAVSKELSMIAEGDEPEDFVDADMVDGEDGEPGDDITVPIRDEPSSNSLKRKGSMSQFSGLPAPSPLRKSMRMSREPSLGVALANGPPPTHTPGAAYGSKRTSWLTKAQQAKKLEGGSGKRHPPSSDTVYSGLVSGASSKDLREAKKAKVGEPLGLGFVLPPPPPHTATDASNDTKIAAPKPPVEVEPSTSKGKQKATSLDGDQGQISSQRAEHQTSLPLALPPATLQLTPFQSEDDLTMHGANVDPEADVLDRLKKTVEDLGARTGKSMGKSLGGHAAAALAEIAEARAAAAARVAQRNRQEGGAESEDEQAPEKSAATTIDVVPQEPVKDMHPRLSVSELTTSMPLEVQKPSAKEQVDHKASASVQNVSIGDTSTSTTPPNSPPVQVSLPPPPVFSKPVAVFNAPKDRAHTTSKDTAAKLPTTNPFSLPPKTLPSATPFSIGPTALSAQSSKTTAFSDTVFDPEDTAPIWMKGKLDAEFTIPITQDDHTVDMNEDSWHVDEKFQSDQTWTPYGFTSSDKDDGSTWSSFPAASTSQRPEDTAFAFPTESLPVPVEKTTATHTIDSETDATGSEKIVNLNLDYDEPRLEENAEMDMDIDDTGESPDLEDLVNSGQPTIALVKSKPDAPRSNSQQSMASTSSSSSQPVGLFGQASRFVNSMLGNGKKAKPEPVKSIALAAAAAKKQQEEAEKKATRIKEMENRRQLTMQRKAEEEKARVVEEERKVKEDAERRKREREEHTDKRPLKALKKPEEDTTKKRKLVVEIGKKPETKKPPSKDGQSSRNVKPGTSNIPSSTTKSGGAFKHAVKQPSVTSLASSVQKPVEVKPTPKPAEVKPTPKPATSSSNLKSAAAKGKGKATDMDDVQPSQLVQSQMAHRAKAQIQAATPRQPPPVASENIELPDINSEYSDSEDEDRPRTFDPPEWAQSPELRQALEQQSHMNPDDIFGQIRPLKMEEIFRTRQSRFRARTSSANWSGPDQLTAEEEKEYARRMGFK